MEGGLLPLVENRSVVLCTGVALAPQGSAGFRARTRAGCAGAREDREEVGVAGVAVAQRREGVGAAGVDRGVLDALQLALFREVLPVDGPVQGQGEAGASLVDRQHLAAQGRFAADPEDLVLGGEPASVQDERVRRAVGRREDVPVGERPCRRRSFALQLVFRVDGLREEVEVAGLASVGGRVALRRDLLAEEVPFGGEAVPVGVRVGRGCVADRPCGGAQQEAAPGQAVVVVEAEGGDRADLVATGVRRGDEEGEPAPAVQGEGLLAFAGRGEGGGGGVPRGEVGLQLLDGAGEMGVVAAEAGEDAVEGAGGGEDQGGGEVQGAGQHEVWFSDRRRWAASSGAVGRAAGSGARAARRRSSRWAGASGRYVRRGRTRGGVGGVPVSKR
ncbi:hypothetical protein Saa2_09147 [Streptomyces acidiscabies]|nr:hypothetical protein Saa2_09147 [Streptomyces acidiscabies]